MIKFDLDINVFVSINCLFLFVVSLQNWLAYFLFIRNNRKVLRNKHFYLVKIKTLSTKLYSTGLRFQGYHCKSDRQCDLCMKNQFNLNLFLFVVRKKPNILRIYKYIFWDWTTENILRLRLFCQKSRTYFWGYLLSHKS